jgi:hypothetical protein
MHVTHMSSLHGVVAVAGEQLLIASWYDMHQHIVLELRVYQCPEVVSPEQRVWWGFIGPWEKGGRHGTEGSAICLRTCSMYNGSIEACR